MTVTDVASPGATLGDRVWYDLDGDGLQDANEPGYAGLVVSLRNAAGTTLASATTDAGGHYTFANLASGNYRVAVALPAGYQGTLKDQGADDTLTATPTTPG